LGSTGKNNGRVGNIPTVFTINEEQTAQFIFSLAKKLQEEKEKVAVRYKIKNYTRADQQQFTVQGLPRIGPKLADKLLRTFGSVRKVFTATKDEWFKVEGFGRKRIEEISQFLDEPYLAESR